MKNKKIFLYSSTILMLTLAACSDKEDSIIKTPTEVTKDNAKVIEKSESLLKDSSNKTPAAKERTQEEIVVSEIMGFQMNHHSFGKYLKEVKLTTDTAVLIFHNSYDDFKQTNQYNIEYNENTFPDIYERYANKGNYQDVNAYLITGSTYILANYPSIERVVYSFPKTPEGKYYTMDVKRDDLFYALGFDVNQLAKEKGEEGWGEKFNLNFASEYSYPLTDEAYDSNKRFLNLFLSQPTEPFKINGEALASIKEYKPNKLTATVQERIESDEAYQHYVAYLEHIYLEKNNLTLELSGDYKEKIDTQADINYLVGRVLADFPELQTIEIKLKNIDVKVNRTTLTNYLNSDIATWVNIDKGDLKDWSTWEEDFFDVMVTGEQKREFFKILVEKTS